MKTTKYLNLKRDLIFGLMCVTSLIAQALEEFEETAAILFDSAP